MTDTPKQSSLASNLHTASHASLFDGRTPWTRPKRTPPDTEETGIFRRPPEFGAGPSRPSVSKEHKRRHDEAGASPAAVSEPQVRSLQSSELGTVRYDAKGDPVWEWRVEVPRRRCDDTTVNLLKCLDSGTLSLAEDVSELRDAERGIDPYDHG